MIADNKKGEASMPDGSMTSADNAKAREAREKAYSTPLD